MLNLYVMRHAKSSWKNKSLQDFERPLSNKGKAEIKFISKFLKKKKLNLIWLMFLQLKELCKLIKN